MRLSALQKYILLECLNSKNSKLNRKRLVKFYNKQKNKPHPELMTKIISQSLERLINKELLVGYGMRTPHKWFIKEIKLTQPGITEARKLLGQQMKIKFKKVKK